MIHLRPAYDPPVRRHASLVSVGAASAVVRTGAVETADVLYVGVPAIAAGAAVTLLGGGLLWGAVAAAAAGGAGYLLRTSGVAVPGDSTTSPAPGVAAKESLKELSYPGGPSGGIESYATETADEKRARELAENWGYTNGVYDYCRMTGSPYDANPLVFREDIGESKIPKTTLLPKRVRFYPGGKRANDVFEENPSLRKIYVSNYPDAYDFGWKAAREDTGVCDASMAFE